MRNKILTIFENNQKIIQFRILDIYQIIFYSILGFYLMKINKTLIENVYTIAKRVYCDTDIGLVEGARYLESEFGWTYSSAIGYIRVFDKMINGELYTRTINGNATEYYLQNIFDDFGYDKLQIALKSIEKHIDYYKNLGPINNIEAIYDVFKRIKKAENIYNEYNDESEEYFNEGKAKRVFVNIYERDKNSRKKCIEYYGYRCFACGLIMTKIYGEIAENFIHVHHLKELSNIKEDYSVDPIKDLRPLCPNCHAIIHRKTPVLSIEELINIIKSNRN